MKPYDRALTALILTLFVALSSPLAAAKESPRQELHYQYHRLLPLEGGSNFRDLGGYKTVDGKTVVRGQLFRSGVMGGLTEADMAYLDGFGFQTVVDMRSGDEIALTPNRWAKSREISYITYDYSIRDLAGGGSPGAQGFAMEEMYKHFPRMLKPQLTMYFDQLLAGNTPLVVNCSAGQDRTGTAAALLLATLGVRRETVVEDFLLSTDYRNPTNERAGMDLEKAGKDNGFAQMMLRYQQGGEKPLRPEILKTGQGVPYIEYLFDQIEKDYGSVENYLEQELGVEGEDMTRLRALYLY